MALAAGSTETDSTANVIKNKQPVYNLTSEQLYGEYDANKIAADAKFKNQVVTVTGPINNIGKDIGETAYLIIGGNGLDGVQCMFPKGQESAISLLSKGQIITAQGQVSGQIVGNILIKSCTLK